MLVNNYFILIKSSNFKIAGLPKFGFNEVSIENYNCIIHNLNIQNDLYYILCRSKNYIIHLHKFGLEMRTLLYQRQLLLLINIS